MKAESFLENFDAVVDAPDGIQQLRDLVMVLAVRGRLVPQDPDDEPAHELLECILRERLVSASTAMLPIDESDGPWRLPSAWRWARFKEVVDFAPGKTPPTKDSTYWEVESGYRWVCIGDMTDGGEVWDTGRHVSQKALEQVFNGDPSPAGTLLMSFKLTLGKVSRLALPAFHNEAIISIYPPYESLGAFLFRSLPLLVAGGDSRAAIMGSTLNKTSLTNLPIPVPPLAEQERIVARVDELMWLCDELEARQEERWQAATRLWQVNRSFPDASGRSAALKQAEQFSPSLRARGCRGRRSTRRHPAAGPQR
jgi:type I restriction enzyme S subunit